MGDDRTGTGFVNIHLFNSSERLTETFKKLGIFWGISLVSVLIPVFHFVSVPLFFILGIFFAVQTFKSVGRVIDGEAVCPHCQNKVLIKPAGVQWPLTEICQNCARVVRMNRQ